MEKAYDSIMTLQMAFFPEYSLYNIREKVNFVFVYKDDCVADKEQESKSFKDIFTVEKTEFMRQIHPMMFGSFSSCKTEEFVI